MKKIMKRILAGLLILIFLLIAALIIIPIVFKPQLQKLVLTEINKSVNAKVDFDFQVSLLKGFPDLYIGLKNLSVVGIDSFANDTLVAFNEFGVKVDIKSVIGMKNIIVKSILLDKPILTAHIRPDGSVNWDIEKPSTDTVQVAEEPVDTSASQPMTMKVALRKFEIRNANIRYIDDSSSMSATIKNLNFLLSGNMGMDYTDLTINTTIDALTFDMDGIRYLRSARVGFKGQIGADMVNSAYTFKENVFNLNAISLFFAGTVKMPGEDIDVDINFGSANTDFKSLLSLVPAIYLSDFEGLKTSGKLKFEGLAKGFYNDKVVPNAHVALVVENAMFQYPDLPKSVSNVNINSQVNFDGANMDNTTVDVNLFHFEMANNPFDAQLHIKTPISDMQMAGLFKGKIDFNSLADAIPLDSMTIKGLLDANIEYEGKMSYIDNEQYDKFKADGTMRLTNFEFTSPDLPQGFKIIETVLNFSPRYVDLAKFESQVGRSDIRMNGRLENFIPFVFKDETIKGNLIVASNHFDANEFLTGEETTDSVAVDTSAMTVVEIPKNIDFVLNTSMKHILYDQLDVADLDGKIVVKNGKATMDNLGMKMLEGSLVMNGEYNSQDIKAPAVNFDIKITDFDIPSTFKAFSTLKKVAPVAKDMKGKISTSFIMKATLDTAMNPVFNSIYAKGKLQSKEIAIANSKVFGKAADALKKESLRNPTLKDVNISFVVKDGRIYIEPFDTKISDFKTNFGGDMGLDQTLNFKAKMSVPSNELGAASNLLSSLTTLANEKGLSVKTPSEIKLNLKITGTVTKPDVGIDWGAGNESAKESTKETIKETAKVEAKKEAKEQAEKLIADAEKEAALIKAEAAELADKTRKEAEEKAKKIVEEGKKKGGLAAQAAKVSAKEVRKQGEASAQKIIKEADDKSKKIIEKAKMEAEKLE